MRKLSSMLWSPSGAQAVLFLLRNHVSRKPRTTSITLPLTTVVPPPDNWVPPPPQDPWARPAWDSPTIFIVPAEYLTTANND